MCLNQEDHVFKPGLLLLLLLIIIILNSNIVIVYEEVLFTKKKMKRNWNMKKNLNRRIEVG